MKKLVKILSQEERFSRMLSLELSDIGVDTVSEFDSTESEDSLFAVVDLDTYPPDALTLLPINAKVICYSRKSSEEIGELPAICVAFLRRPFQISTFLSHFGHTERIRQTVRITNKEISEPKINKLTVDQDSKNARWGDEVIPLSENEYKVLSLLCQNRGEAVNRETIDMLLGADESNMGDVYVCHLRRKIDHKLGLKLIYTIRGKGYMLKN